MAPLFPRFREMVNGLYLYIHHCMKSFINALRKMECFIIICLPSTDIWLLFKFPISPPPPRRLRVWRVAPSTSSIRSDSLSSLGLSGCQVQSSPWADVGVGENEREKEKDYVGGGRSSHLGPVDRVNQEVLTRPFLHSTACINRGDGSHQHSVDVLYLFSLH